MPVMTPGNLCINTCNLSSVAWFLLVRGRNVKDLITLVFGTGTDVYKYFAHLIKKVPTPFKNF